LTFRFELERCVLSLIIIVFVVTAAALAVLLYVGSVFLQGYIYTEPSAELYWQAPAAAGVMALFLTLWCALVANSEGVSRQDIPFDTLFHFSPRVDLLKEPADKIWALKKDGSKTLYTRQRTGQTTWRYVDNRFTPARPWRGDGVESVELINGGQPEVFKRVPGSDGSYGEFVSEGGWAMKDYEDGPTGNPSIFRWSRFLLTLMLNLCHFLLWWLCLWLLVRFQWSHALGIGFILWLVLTLTVLPMLLDYAAGVGAGA
jgi:hypothetical protein